MLSERSDDGRTQLSYSRSIAPGTAAVSLGGYIDFGKEEADHDSYSVEISFRCNTALLLHMLAL